MLSHPLTAQFGRRACCVKGSHVGFCLDTSCLQNLENVGPPNLVSLFLGRLLSRTALLATRWRSAQVAEFLPHVTPLFIFAMAHSLAAHFGLWLRATRGEVALEREGRCLKIRRDKVNRPVSYLVVFPSPGPWIAKSAAELGVPHTRCLLIAF